MTFASTCGRQRGIIGMQDMIMTALVITILGAIFASKAGDILGYTNRARIERANVDNRAIADALYEYARLYSSLGKLTDPGSNSSIYNAGDSSAANLTALFSQAGLNISEINTDGTAAGRARVYQKVAGISQTLPLNSTNGSLVTLTYDVGVVYLTDCPVGQTSCYTGGRPGNSPTLTSANATSWTADPNDYAPAIVSTQSLQRSKLTTTINTINQIRDRMTEYFAEQQRSASAGVTSNFWPQPVGWSAPTGSVTGDGCQDGWYDLNNTAQAILTKIGLDPATQGVTAWDDKTSGQRATIQYCRDYDPAGEGRNIPPHYAALRINKFVSNGVAPDGTALSNNIIISF